jgi:cysteine synthase A
MARLFGIDSTCAIVDHSIAPSLLRMLRLFGIEVYMHPGPGHELFGKLPPRSERAAECGRQAGWLNPGQYSNPDNPEGFAQWLGPELWAQTRGRLGVLSCALGTCGTMVGVSRALRERDSSIEIVACCPKPGDAVPGPREKSLLSDVSFPWQDVANARMELSAEESFAASVRLLRKGILGGPSSGMNYAGALRYLEQEKSARRLAPRVESHGELWCVFLCCDSPLPHVDEYYEALGEEHFPVVHPIPEATADRR